MKWGYTPPPGPRGAVPAPLSRAGDLRSVAPFLRELEALCRRRGFVLEISQDDLIVADMNPKDLPGHYKITPRASGSRANSTAIFWRPGRIPR